MDPTLKVSKKFPDKVFLHCSGFKQSKNMGNYFGRMYQAKYLAAMIAGGMSKKGRIGIVGSQPIPEIIRHINAITLGAQAVNPNVTVEVIWINSWFDPAKESDAAQALIDNGADVIVTMADSPATVQTSKKNGVYAIGNDTDMAIYGKEAHLTAAVWNWDVYYLEAVKAVENGTWKAGSHWWGLDSGIVGLTSFHPDVPQSLIIRMNKEKGKILSGTMDVFGHGFTKQDGTRVINALNDGEMLGMMYYVKGIISKIPSG
jgi:basic membrane protein A